MITSKEILEIFKQISGDNCKDVKNEMKINRLIKNCFKTNLKLWELEDSARIKEKGFEHIANVKDKIDKYNQRRNVTIEKMDICFATELKNDPSQPFINFVSESPGMLVDRLSILFIKLLILEKLTFFLEDKYLRTEYILKRQDVKRQVIYLSQYLDNFFLKISKREIFFINFCSVKIYNDERVRKYLNKVDTYRN